jgi:hypothetical protein
MSKHQEFEMPVVKTLAERSSELRDAFPECSAMVDEMRSLFGSVQVLTLSEGDKEYCQPSYKPDSEFSLVINGADFLRMGALSKQAHEAANGKVTNAKRK